MVLRVCVYRLNKFLPVFNGVTSLYYLQPLFIRITNYSIYNLTSSLFRDFTISMYYNILSSKTMSIMEMLLLYSLDMFLS